MIFEIDELNDFILYSQHVFVVAVNHALLPSRYRFFQTRQATSKDHYKDAGRNKLCGLLVPNRLKDLLFGMRQNGDDCVAFLYTLAQVLIPTDIWWDKHKIKEGLTCGTGALNGLLTVNDEVFLLVVTNNYITPWSDKMMSNQTKAQGRDVQNCADRCDCMNKG